MTATRHGRAAALLCGLWLAAPGCTRQGPNVPQSPGAGPLHVAAASDLQTVLPALIERFNREPPTFQVIDTYGASGQIAEQIKAGAPYDIFLAANEAYVRDLATERFLIPESVKPYAIGSLALAVNPSKAAVVKALADLAKPEVKAVAIANPEFAPYGKAAQTALERAGLWEKVAPKLVRAETVRQALQFVETGNAEAGLVGLASARAAKVIVVAVDAKLYDPIVQGLGVVARSDNTTAANLFLNFLNGPSGREVLKEHGFLVPVAGGGMAAPAPR